MAVSGGERIVRAAGAVLHSARKVSSGIWDGMPYTADEWITELYVPADGTWKAVPNFAIRAEPPLEAVDYLRVFGTQANNAVEWHRLALSEEELRGASGERQAAEDVLQEVYLIVWRRASSFEPLRSSPITWLATSGIRCSG